MGEASPLALSSVSDMSADSASSAALGNSSTFESSDGADSETEHSLCQATED